MPSPVIEPRRTGLEAIRGRRVEVTATYWGLGTRRSQGKSHQTVLLRDVRSLKTGQLFADHLWFNRGSRWKKVPLKRGDRIRFAARSVEYRTGYWGANTYLRAVDPPRREFKLTFPEHLVVILGHGTTAGRIGTRGRS